MGRRVGHSTHIVFLRRYSGHDSSSRLHHTIDETFLGDLVDIDVKFDYFVRIGVDGHVFRVVGASDANELAAAVSRYELLPILCILLLSFCTLRFIYVVCDHNAFVFRVVGAFDANELAAAISRYEQLPFPMLEFFEFSVRALEPGIKSLQRHGW